MEKEEFKSAFERSGQPDLDRVSFENFIEAYGSSNWVKLHEIYVRGEMPVDDETAFSWLYFKSDLAAAIITRDAAKSIT